LTNRLEFAIVIFVPTKTKNTISITQKLAEAAQNAGLLMMTAAVTVGMLELPEHSKRVVIPSRPVFEFAETSHEANPDNNPLRREREETGPHYVSYSVAQRTPSRSGKH
jgi:hypothetical protein